jgi:hypothetical protein
VHARQGQAGSKVIQTWADCAGMSADKEPKAPQERYQPPFQRANTAHADELGHAPPPPPPGSSPFIITPQAYAADAWLYKDPQGQVQGPFTRIDILDWYQSGFFTTVSRRPHASEADLHAMLSRTNQVSIVEVYMHPGTCRTCPSRVRWTHPALPLHHSGLS